MYSAIIIATRFMKVFARMETATRFALRTANNLRGSVFCVFRKNTPFPPPLQFLSLANLSLSLSSLVRNHLLVSHFNTHGWKARVTGRRTVSIVFHLERLQRMEQGVSSRACSELEQPHNTIDRSGNVKPFRDWPRETRRPLFAVARPYWRLATSQQIFSAISSSFPLPPSGPDQTHIVVSVSQL